MQKLRTTFIALMLIITALAAQSQSFSNEVSGFIQYRQGNIVITDVKVIDGTGSPAKEHQWVLIENDRIASIGKSTEIKIPEGATIIDGKGKAFRAW